MEKSAGIFGFRAGGAEFLGRENFSSNPGPLQSPQGVFQFVFEVCAPKAPQGGSII